MNYTFGHLDTVSLARRFSAPLHLYDARRIAENIQILQKVFIERGLDGAVCYAVKACGFREILRIAAKGGAGADVASEYELATALEAGIAPAKLVIHGNAKSREYLERSVALNALITANHHTELDRIEAEAGKQRKEARVLLRLSGFDLGPVTATGIFTAGVWCKFGEPVAQVPSLLTALKKWPHIDLSGFHVHIGSQITEAEPYRVVLGRMAELSGQYQGITGRPVRILNLGGGFPVSYAGRRSWNKLLKDIPGHYLKCNARPIPQPTRGRKGLDSGFRRTDGKRLSQKGRWPTWQGMTGGFKPDHRTGKMDWGHWTGEEFYSPYPKEKMLARLLGGKIPYDGSEAPVKKVLEKIGNPKLIVEPGRAIVGDAGITLARVMEVYPVAGGHPLVTLDLGIVNHGTGLVEPDLYPWTLANDRERKDRRPFRAFVAGRLCFSGDMLSRYPVSFPRKPIRGDIAVIEKTGAYAPAFFASRANGFPLPSTVLIHKGQRTIKMDGQ
jgi:diaminopimelate decarboxylase